MYLGFWVVLPPIPSFSACIGQPLRLRLCGTRCQMSEPNIAKVTFHLGYLVHVILKQPVSASPSGDKAHREVKRKCVPNGEVTPHWTVERMERTHSMYQALSTQASQLMKYLCGGQASLTEILRSLCAVARSCACGDHLPLGPRWHVLGWWLGGCSNSS